MQGLAASVPFDRNDPAAPMNRRISIIVMNRDAEERLLRGEPELNLGAAEPAPAAAPGATPLVRPGITPLAPPR